MYVIEKPTTCWAGVLRIPKLQKKKQIFNNQNTLLTMTIYDGTVAYAINSYK